MNYKKSQNPLMNNGFGIYPLTTADQIILNDGSRLEKNGSVTSNDSYKLGGVDASNYALKTDTAPDSSKLGGKTLAEIMLELYPVGSVYMSFENTSPASLFGGAWEQFHDYFLLAAGHLYDNGSTGGASTINLNHIHSTAATTLTEAQLPHVSGYITMHSAEDNSKGSSWWNPTGVFSSSPTHSVYVTPSGGSSAASSISGISFNMGSGEAHSHGDTGSSLSSSQSIMPPYLAVYMWKRVS